MYLGYDLGGSRLVELAKRPSVFGAAACAGLNIWHKAAHTLDEEKSTGTVGFRQHHFAATTDSVGTRGGRR